MNAPLPDTSKAQPAQNGRDLNSAIVACFSPETATPPFAERLIELTAALTSQQNLSLWQVPKSDETAELLAAHRRGDPDQAPASLVADILEEAVGKSASLLKVADGYIGASIAMPTGKLAVALMEMPASGAVARSLAYERLTLLANLSFAQFRHGDLTGQSEMIQAVAAVAGGDHSKLQELADRMARITGADYAAAGLCNGGTVREVTISGQQGLTKRAQLPVQLRTKMEEIARKKIVTNDQMFAAAPDREDGLALVIEGPTRNLGVMRMAGAIYAQAQHNKPKSKWTAARLVKTLSILLAIGAIGLIPIADGVDVSASVESAQTRTITAPLTSTISEVLVSDKDTVIAGETILAKLDTSLIDI